MNLSRRSLGKRGVAMLAVSSIPQEISGALALNPCFSALQIETASGLPKFVVEDFSRVFDPAYLSNGLIGIRPGPNPLAKAQTCVSGFDFVHPAYKVECLSPAPYPLETDIRIGGMSLLQHPDDGRHLVSGDASPQSFARTTSLRRSSMATLVTPSKASIVGGCCGTVSVSEDNQK